MDIDEGDKDYKVKNVCIKGRINSNGNLNAIRWSRRCITVFNYSTLNDRN